MVNTNGPNFNINIDPSNKGPYKSHQSTGKNFEKVLRKDRHEERAQDEEKKFKKLDDNEVAAKEEFDEVVASSQHIPSKKSTGSIFDVIVEDEAAVTEIPPELEKESLSALFKELGTKEKLEKLQAQVNEEKPTEYLPEKPNTKFAFAVEHPDITSVNQVAPLQTISTKEVTPPPKTSAVTMQALIDQIVKEMSIVTSTGKTETVMTLKHPPLFEGATVTLTSFQSAKGEFNIAFGNLSQAAKHLIDMSENQSALKNSLEQKGYMVHIVIATTADVENKQTVKGEELGSRRDGEGQNQDREDKEEREG